MIDPITAISAVGAISNLISGNKAAKAQNKATNAQASIANQQAGLFGASSPYYNLLLQAMGQHLGFPGPQMVPQGPQSAGGVLGRAGVMQPGHGSQMQMPTTLPQGFNQNPFENTADRARLQQANTAISHNYQNAAHNLSYGLGRRGLTGSNLDVAGRTQLLADASRQQGNFQQQLAINAPQEFERRLSMFANLLNPGLGAGPSAAGMYGNQASMYGQQAGAAGSNLSSIMQNYMMQDALKKYQSQRSNLVLDDFINQGL
jgi:hypothetical protein